MTQLFANGEVLKNIRGKINSAIQIVDGLGQGDALLMTAAERAKLGDLVAAIDAAAGGTNWRRTWATTADVDAAVAELVGSSPEALDTLNELAAALGDDPNFATTVTNQIATKAPAATAVTSDPTGIPDAIRANGLLIFPTDVAWQAYRDSAAYDETILTFTINSEA